ncbi:uncharacterized protein [Nicotiana tomentosiformis]|uniref:uncharacterized protein n=1 Tax=Nicotiana tomentosiformis TaxID=4098 RepID=UPI00388C58F6
MQQSHQPMITAPVAASPVLPTRGRGKAVGVPNRFYAFQVRLEVVSANGVITCIISICHGDASELFDPGSTYFYVSSLFNLYLDISRESLGVLVYVSMPVGDSVVVDQFYQSCIVTFYVYEARADLQLLDMIYFKVILGMDWLSPYHAILIFHAKTVTLAMSNCIG